jgi:hypothetical protein
VGSQTAAGDVVTGRPDRDVVPARTQDGPPAAAGPGSLQSGMFGSTDNAEVARGPHTRIETKKLRGRRRDAYDSFSFAAGKVRVKSGAPMERALSIVVRRLGFLILVGSIGPGQNVLCGRAR